MFFKRKKCQIPDYVARFIVINTPVKDMVISDSIPRNGRIFYKLLSSNNTIELYLRNKSKDKKSTSENDCIDIINRNYYDIGELESSDIRINRFIVHLKNFIKYINSVTIDIVEGGSVNYIFRFYNITEDKNLDGYLIIKDPVIANDILKLWKKKFVCKSTRKHRK